MTPKEADRIIREGKPVKVIGRLSRGPFTALFISRDRWTITAADGAKYDRSDLQVVYQNAPVPVGRSEKSD